MSLPIILASLYVWTLWYERQISQINPRQWWLLVNGYLLCSNCSKAEGFPQKSRCCDGPRGNEV